MTATVLSGVLANLGYGERLYLLTHEAHHVWGLAAFLMLSVFVLGIAEALTSALRREAVLNQQLSVVGRKLSERLHALSRAQRLLIESGSEAVSLGVLVRQVLCPFELADHLDGPVGGPEVSLRPAFVVPITLLLNELATNATKYGALSATAGRLKLNWVERDGSLVIDWKERGGPAVALPTRLGFGSRLFDTALPRASGSVERRFKPAGLECTITMSLA